MDTKLRAWRERAGLSRPEAARAFLVSTETVKNWENGTTLPSLRVQRLLEAQPVQG